MQRSFQPPPVERNTSYPASEPPRTYRRSLASVTSPATPRTRNRRYVRAGWLAFALRVFVLPKLVCGCLAVTKASATAVKWADPEGEAAAEIACGSGMRTEATPATHRASRRAGMEVVLAGNEGIATPRPHR